jgi:hypothetical protein
VDFGQNDLLFTYQNIFDNTELPLVRGGTLWVIYYLSDIYKQTNFGKRKGKCYLIKKGNNKINPRQLRGQLIVDGLTHIQRASVFNECEYCISYDSASMLSLHAALCGCCLVVIPDEGVDQDSCQPETRYRTGIAYGFSEKSLAWARNTREKLPSLLLELQEESLKSVKDFVSRCDDYFS